jgi:hypothetical protein
MPSIGQTWVLASIGAVVEMGVLSTLKRLLMESKSVKRLLMESKSGAASRKAQNGKRHGKD